MLRMGPCGEVLACFHVQDKLVLRIGRRSNVQRSSVQVVVPVPNIICIDDLDSLLNEKDGSLCAVAVCKRKQTSSVVVWGHEDGQHVTHELGSDLDVKAIRAESMSCLELLSIRCIEGGDGVLLTWIRLECDGSAIHQSSRVSKRISNLGRCTANKTLDEIRCLEHFNDSIRVYTSAACVSTQVHHKRELDADVVSKSLRHVFASDMDLSNLSRRTMREEMGLLCLGNGRDFHLLENTTRKDDEIGLIQSWHIAQLDETHNVVSESIYWNGERGTFSLVLLMHEDNGTVCVRGFDETSTLQFQYNLATGPVKPAMLIHDVLGSDCSQVLILTPGGSVDVVDANARVCATLFQPIGSTQLASCPINDRISPHDDSNLSNGLENIRTNLISRIATLQQKNQERIESYRVHERLLDKLEAFVCDDSRNRLDLDLDLLELVHVPDLDAPTELIEQSAIPTVVSPSSDIKIECSTREIQFEGLARIVVWEVDLVVPPNVTVESLAISLQGASVGTSRFRLLETVLGADRHSINHYLVWTRLEASHLAPHSQVSLVDIILCSVLKVNRGLEYIAQVVDFASLPVSIFAATTWTPVVSTQKSALTPFVLSDCSVSLLVEKSQSESIRHDLLANSFVRVRVVETDDTHDRYEVEAEGWDRLAATLCLIKSKCHSAEIDWACQVNLVKLAADAMLHETRAGTDLSLRASLATDELVLKLSAEFESFDID